MTIISDRILRRLVEQNWPAQTRPTVSVLVTAFNHELFIRDCLESILGQQTDFPVEIIVHDDASTDATANIIRQYAIDYLHIVRPILQTQNQMSQHRRIRPMMLKTAQGDYIANCDGDDQWTDEKKLVKQARFLQENPQYILSYHGFEKMDVKGSVLKKSNFFKKRYLDYSQSDLRVLAGFTGSHDWVSDICDSAKRHRADAALYHYCHGCSRIRWLSGVVPAANRWRQRICIHLSPLKTHGELVVNRTLVPLSGSALCRRSGLYLPALSDLSGPVFSSIRSIL